MQLGGPQLYRPRHKPHQGTLLCYQAQGLRAAPSPRASMTFLSSYILIILSRVWPLLSVLLYSRPSLVSQSSISPKLHRWLTGPVMSFSMFSLSFWLAT